MSQVLDVEIQLLRDWEPRSRPTMGRMDIGGPPQQTLLAPGAAARGHEQMLVTLEGATRTDHLMASVWVGVTIDGVQLGSVRPALVYLGRFDSATGVVHYPRVAETINHMFGGYHVVLLRVVI